MAVTPLLRLGSMARPPVHLLRASGSTGVGWLFGCVLLTLMLASVVFVWRSSSARPRAVRGPFRRLRNAVSRALWMGRRRDLAWLDGEVRRAMSDPELTAQARRRLGWRNDGLG